MIDTHAHLADKRFNDDREEVIKRCRENNVTKVLCICSDFDELDGFSGLIKEHEFIYGAAGAHPHDASKYDEGRVLESIAGEKIVALGEIGLDYHYNHSPGNTQREVFRKQLRIAKSRNLPVIIHSREAMNDTINILREEDAGRGVMHCFSGSEHNLEECLELGLYISIAGPVTFPNSARLRKVASKVPSDKLLVETDCPYLAPQPVRGKRNEPSYVKYIIEELSGLRNVPADELEEQTSQNAESLFNLK